VNIDLGLQAIDACPVFDCEATGTAPVSCLIRGVNHSLSGCGADGCPIEAGTYTITQTSGGVLQVGALPPISFPAGGTVVLDVKPASPLHNERFHRSVTLEAPRGIAMH